LILVPQAPLPIHIADGTNLTIQETKKQNKPCLIIDLPEKQNIQSIVSWVKMYNIQVLNIAGPRESQCPGIYQKSYDLLAVLFPALFT